MSDNELTYVEKFLTCLLEPFQELEDVFQQLLVGRTVDQAIGVQLDMLGVIVGQPRNGIADDDIYRRYIRAKLATNNSDGLIEDLIRIADLIVYDDDATFVIDNHGVAALTMTIAGVQVSTDLAYLLSTYLQRAVAAGVRIILEYGAGDPEDMFEFESFVPGNGPGKGWGSSLDADVGGELAGAF